MMSCEFAGQRLRTIELRFWNFEQSFSLFDVFFGRIGEVKRSHRVWGRYWLFEASFEVSTKILARYHDHTEYCSQLCSS